MNDLFNVTVTVNGTQYTRAVEPRLLLSDFLRHELGLTGTHVGCEHGVCGACTVLFDGEPVRSCRTIVCELSRSTIRLCRSHQGPACFRGRRQGPVREPQCPQRRLRHVRPCL